MAKNHYEVIVGNIGSVYRGSSEERALSNYNEYVSQSKSHRGRAGDEVVTLFRDGEIIKEHEPDRSKTVSVSVVCKITPTEADAYVSQEEAEQTARKVLRDILEHADNGGFPVEDRHDLPCDVSVEYTVRD